MDRGQRRGQRPANYSVTWGPAESTGTVQTIAAPAVGTTLTGLDACTNYAVTLTCTDRAGNISTSTAEVRARAVCGGDGTFTASTLALSHAPNAIVGADVDDDGIADLVVGVGTDVQVHLGNGSNGRGNGTLTAGEILAAGGMVNAIAVADLDADGIEDLAVATTSEVRIFKGDGTEGVGDGTFTLHATISSNLSTPKHVLARDVDFDAIPDLIVANFDADTIASFRGNGSGGRGNGTFTFVEARATGDAPGALAAGDFNADGITDLAVGCQSGGEVLVTHLGDGSNGRGDATFAAGTTLVTGGFVCGDVLVADHNCDGIDDLVCSFQLADSVFLFAGSGTNGRGTGAFYFDEVIPVGARPWGLAQADCSGDHRPDFVVASYLQDGLTLLRANGEHGRGDGTYTTSTIGGVGASLLHVLATDLDENGAPDVVATDTNNALVLLRGNGGQQRGDGTFGSREHDVSIIGLGFGVGVADLNDDSVDDLIVASFQIPTGGGQDWVTAYFGPEVEGLGTGLFTAGDLWFCGSGPTRTAFGDFDRNAIQDTVVLACDLEARGGGNRIDVLLGGGSNGIGDGSVASSNNTATGTTPRDM